MGIYDVPAGYVIEEASKKLASEIEAPAFTAYVKTGMHRERAPQRDDWFHVRMASILYRAYKWGAIGTERLRSYYGGRRNRGLKTEHHYKASGKVIRSAVQTLEKAGYLEKAQPKGRKVSTKGFRLLNEASKIADKNLAAGLYVKKEKVHVDDKKKREVADALRGQQERHDNKDKKPQQDKEKKKKGGEE
ncbi:MAG: 40S ribosomal protein S19 [archaeon]